MNSLPISIPAAAPATVPDGLPTELLPDGGSCSEEFDQLIAQEGPAEEPSEETLPIAPVSIDPQSLAATAMIDPRVLILLGSQTPPAEAPSLELPIEDGAEAPVESVRSRDVMPETVPIDRPELPGDGPRALGEQTWRRSFPVIQDAPKQPQRPQGQSTGPQLPPQVQASLPTQKESQTQIQPDALLSPQVSNEASRVVADPVAASAVAVSAGVANVPVRKIGVTTIEPQEGAVLPTAKSTPVVFNEAEEKPAAPAIVPGESSEPSTTAADVDFAAFTEENHPQSGVKTKAGTAGAKGGSDMIQSPFTQAETPAAKPASGQQHRGGEFQIEANFSDSTTSREVPEEVGRRVSTSAERPEATSTDFRPNPTAWNVEQPRHVEAPRIQEGGVQQVTSAEALLGEVGRGVEQLKHTDRSRMDLQVKLEGGETIQIKLSVSTSGAVEATFTTQSQELQDTLRQQWPGFVEKSESNGIRVGELKFNQNGQSFGGDSTDGRQREQQTRFASEYENPAEGQLPQARRSRVEERSSPARPAKAGLISWA